MSGCGVCGRPLAPGAARCRNPLCASASRWFRWNVAVAERSGLLEEALNAYKYRGDRSRACVFGAMLAGFLAQRSRLVDGFDLVIASPTFVGTGGRDFDHVRLILAEAARRSAPGGGVRFDLESLPAIVKTGPTPRLAGRAHRERRRIAEERLRPLLRVPDPRRTAGGRILVFDDVFTDGRTLDEVARALRLHGGAREVCGIALCRQPWRDRASLDASAA
ncbi:MAG: ComF family protein [Candidatus Dormibacteria bacterium]